MDGAFERDVVTVLRVVSAGATGKPLRGAFANQTILELSLYISLQVPGSTDKCPTMAMPHYTRDASDITSIMKSRILLFFITFYVSMQLLLFMYVCVKGSLLTHLV